MPDENIMFNRFISKKQIESAINDNSDEDIIE